MSETQKQDWAFPLFRILAVIIIIALIGIFLVMGKYNKDELILWNHVDTVSFTLSNDVTSVKVDLPSNKFLILLDEVNNYTFKLGSKIDWKPVTVCTIDALTMDSHTKVTCTNTDTSKESEVQTISNDTGYYQQQVMMALLRAIEDTNDTQ